MGGRGATKNAVENIKLKKATFEVIGTRGNGDTTWEVSGRTFTYKGMGFGIQGNAKDGYRLTHLESGMLANGRLYNKLNDFKEDIDATYKALKKSNMLESAKERFKKAQKRKK